MWYLLGVFAVFSTFFVFTAGVSPARCGKYEEYSDCANANCRPSDCSEVGYRDKPCPTVEKCDCKGGCICQEGYVKNADGVCISARECPSCGGDENAVYGCGVYCNKRCSDINQPIKSCILVCYPNSCDCKDGFYLDENTKKCVYPKQCSPKCSKPNEVSSNCVNGICGPRNCSQVGYPISCTNVEPCDCVGGCTCQDNYVYDCNGKCIPRTECPSCGGDSNAVSGCGSCVKRCIDVGSSAPRICPRICFPNSCDCKKSFVLDTSTNQCIRPEKCVTCGGDANAKPGCDKTCSRRCPGPKPAKCTCPEKGSCMCKDNFLYDPATKTCVKRKDCTPSSSC